MSTYVISHKIIKEEIVVTTTDHIEKYKGYIVVDVGNGETEAILQKDIVEIEII